MTAPRRKPVHRERPYHKHLAAVLKRACRKTVWFHVPNGEKRDKQTAALLRQMGVRRGVADFILLCRGRAIAVEVKYEDEGSQSLDQEGFQAAWERAGGLYLIVRNPHEIEGLVFKLLLD